MRRLAAIGNWGVGQWSALAGIIGSIATVAALFLSSGDDGDTGTTPDPMVEEPKAVARTALRNFHGARWDALWHQLHPVDKQAAGRQEFVTCQKRAGAPSGLLSLNLEDPIPHRGLARPGISDDAVLVVDATERTRSRISGRIRVETVPVSVYVAKDGDDWKLLLDPGEYAAFRRDRCPYGTDASGDTPSANPGDLKLP